MNNREIKAEGSANAKPAKCWANEGAEGDRNRKGSMEKKDKKKVGQIGGGPRRKWE